MGGVFKPVQLWELRYFGIQILENMCKSHCRITHSLYPILKR